MGFLDELSTLPYNTNGIGLNYSNPNNLMGSLLGNSVAPSILSTQPTNNTQISTSVPSLSYPGISNTSSSSITSPTSDLASQETPNVLGVYSGSNGGDGKSASYSGYGDSTGVAGYGSSNDSGSSNSSNSGSKSSSNQTGSGFGQTASKVAGSVLGSVLGGVVAGPIGSLIGGALLGNLLGYGYGMLNNNVQQPSMSDYFSSPANFAAYADVYGNNYFSPEVSNMIGTTQLATNLTEPANYGSILDAYFGPDESEAEAGPSEGEGTGDSGDGDGSGDGSGDGGDGGDGGGGE